jgi:hypothetical protein
MKREDVENEPTTAAAADDAAPPEKSDPDRLPPLIRPFVDGSWLRPPIGLDRGPSGVSRCLTERSPTRGPFPEVSSYRLLNTWGSLPRGSLRI